MDVKINKANPHSNALRKGRYSENNRIYLVTTVTCQRQKVFLQFDVGRIVVHAMRQQHDQENVESLAFVVMPDHLHWLFALQKHASLAKVMQRVKGNSAYRIQKTLRKRSEMEANQVLWQDGYHDHAVRREEDLQQLARYIVANPLRAGLVSKVGDYPLWNAVWL